MQRVAAVILVCLGVVAGGCGGAGGVDGPPPPAEVATVTLTPATSVLLAGQTRQLDAVLKDASGNVITGRTVTWQSSATNVATVSGGLVTAVASGEATITATEPMRSPSTST